MSTSAIEVRVKEVEKEIGALARGVEGGYIDIGYLLMEAQGGSYHTLRGFKRLEDWAKEHIGTGHRQAFYCKNIAAKADDLGMTKEQLKKCKISTLKEIFSLDPSEHGDVMKDMVKQGKKLSLEDAKSKVKQIKGGNGEVTITEGEDREPETKLTFKVTEAQKAVIAEALELTKKNAGVTTDAEALTYMSGFLIETVAPKQLQNAA